MEDKVKDFIIAKVFAESGIIIAPIHALGVLAYVEKFIKKKKITPKEYCESLDNDSNILKDLINHATTNETYFFREEKQFDYLKNVLFPKFKDKKLVIWSAACSTGEEPLSLLALALRFNIDIDIYASDIDDNVLDFFKKGVYSRYSFRNDGAKYHSYIEQLGEYNEDKSLFIFNKEVLKKVKIFKYNLTDNNSFPFNVKFDIVFLRNVFIYFDQKTRKLITKKVSDLLNDNGYLFYSINEICNIGTKIVPEYMKKINYNQIYFYKKIEKQLDSKNLNNDCYGILPSQVFNSLNKALEKKEYDKAYKLACDYKPVFSDSFYSSFFKGYVLMAANSFVEADKYFSTSEFMKNEFWVAYYFHGLLLEKMKMFDKARNCFKNCLKILDSYINDKNKEYDFLLQNVSCSFVYSYCKKASKEGINGV